MLVDLENWEENTPPKSRGIIIICSPEQQIVVDNLLNKLDKKNYEGNKLGSIFGIPKACLFGEQSDIHDLDSKKMITGFNMIGPDIISGRNTAEKLVIGKCQHINNIGIIENKPMGFLEEYFNDYAGLGNLSDMYDEMYDEYRIDNNIDDGFALPCELSKHSQYKRTFVPFKASGLKTKKYKTLNKRDNNPRKKVFKNNKKHTKRK